jgi:hypothetical protein
MGAIACCGNKWCRPKTEVSDALESFAADTSVIVGMTHAGYQAFLSFLFFGGS